MAGTVIYKEGREGGRLKLLYIKKVGREVIIRTIIYKEG